MYNFMVGFVMFSSLTSIFVCTYETYLYENQNRYNAAMARRFINFRRQVFDPPMDRLAHPLSLPSAPPSSKAAVHSPWEKIYQGTKRIGDIRIYDKRFSYDAVASAHQVFCEGLFECEITHMAVETKGGTPMIIRGGAGYRHFTVLAKAKAGDQLSGRVRAYCRRKKESSLG